MQNNHICLNSYLQKKERKKNKLIQCMHIFSMHSHHGLQMIIWNFAFN
uniref:Uncharacterized protein n=1 Tax=Arundo donax TaxID=35708 RepID=A0A0A8ZHL1_ARUDO